MSETAFNDGSYRGDNTPGINAYWNVWSVSMRLGSNFRTTRNPVNTLPCQAGAALAGPCQTAAFGSMHAGGANFLFADGHVSFLKNSINYSVYNALGTKDMGEAVGGDAF